MKSHASAANAALLRRLAWLEAENDRLRSAIEALRADRMILHDLMRQEAGRCSNA